MRLLALALLAACPAPRSANQAGGALDPGACGDLTFNDVGRKLYEFLVASAELDRATADMEAQLHDACARMAEALGASPAGDTRAVCQAAKTALVPRLVEVSAEAVRYTPPVCTMDAGVTAKIAGECEARAPADMKVTSDGGYASVDASEQCKSAAEVRASLAAQCTEPKIEILSKAGPDLANAIQAGMPALMTLSARGELLAKALPAWAQTAANLGQAPAELAEALGAKSVCVAGQLAAAANAAQAIQARISVSVDVQASFSTP